jgi:putative heme-binding domain-containing protein
MVRRAALWLVTVLAPVGAQDAGLELYRANCYVCHGENGDQVPGVNFRAGIRRASTEDELSRIISGGIPGTGMPPTNLTEAQRGALVVYLRSMRAITGGGKAAGDAARGLVIFEGKGGCVGCHRAGGRGSYFGPDLSDIGATRNEAYLQRSILNPNETIAPQNRLVRVITKQGVTITGRRLNEDTYTIQLVDEKDRLISLSKSDLREYSLLKTSTMPSYQARLSAQEVADVVSYLLALKGSQ